jgi:metal-responsive CopG/Arc/MetJ family transcriptional regulator
MRTKQTKDRITVSIDADTRQRVDSITGINRSKLINELLDEWLDENNY